MQTTKENGHRVSRGHRAARACLIQIQEWVAKAAGNSEQLSWGMIAEPEAVRLMDHYLGKARRRAEKSLPLLESLCGPRLPHGWAARVLEQIDALRRIMGRRSRTDFISEDLPEEALEVFRAHITLVMDALPPEEWLYGLDFDRDEGVRFVPSAVPAVLPPLKFAAKKVVDLLRDHPDGLTSNEMKEKLVGVVKGPAKTLRTLCKKHAEWNAVIMRPGGHGGRASEPQLYVLSRTDRPIVAPPTPSKPLPTSSKRAA